MNKNLAKTKTALSRAKRTYRFNIRRNNHKHDISNINKLHSILTSNPAALHKAMKSSKKTFSGKVPFLNVGDKRYPEDRVGDGLYDSISSLKMQDQTSLQASPTYDSWSQDYLYILELCKHKRDMPFISLEESTRILHKMKPNVSDFWSITPNHFINACYEGSYGFNFLMNRVILEINTSFVEELNTAFLMLEAPLTL